MPDRCDLTDLLPDQCGCRHHRDSPDPTAAGLDDLAVTHWFTAAYPGRCARCDGDIAPGDRIGRTTGDAYVCCEPTRADRPGPAS